MNEILENISISLGVLLTVLSFAVVPFLAQNSKIPPILKGISAGLFLTGFSLKITRIDRTIKDLNQAQEISRNKNIEKVLLDINRHASSTKPLYLQTTSKVFADTICEKVFHHATNIIEHIKNDHSTIIEVDNFTPAYELMREIVSDIGKKYAYIATSKLSSYNLIANDQFNGFSTILEQKVGEDQLFACRLYYHQSLPNPLKKQEMQEASQKKIIVKYNVDQQRNFNFDNSHDLAFLMAPPRIPVNIPNLRTDLNDQNPIDFLSRNGYQKICVIHFWLNEVKIDNSRSIREVTKMQIISHSYRSEYNKYEDEFKTNWNKATNIS